MKTEEKKKIIQQKINRLKEQEAKLNIKERKKRTRRLIELGGLVDKAEISHLSSSQLLGAFLEIQSKSLDESVLEKWHKSGDAAFNSTKGKIENEKPIIIKFPEEPDISIRKKLRSFGMRWNSVRKEWEGIVDPSALRSQISFPMQIIELSLD